MSGAAISETKDPEDVMERPLSAKLVLRLFATLGPCRWLIIMSCILVCICVAADLEMISHMRTLIDRPDLATAPIFSLVLPFLILALINRSTGWVQWIFASIAANRAVADLRKQFFVKLQALPKSFFDHHRAGWLVARSTGDMSIILDFLTFALMMIGIFLTAVGMSVYKIARISPILLVPALLTAPLVTYITIRYKRQMSRVQRFARKKNSELVATMTETVRGVRVVQAFSREQHNLDVFNTLNLTTHDTEIRAARLNALFIPSMDFLGILNATLVICLGSLMIHRGTSAWLPHALTPGDLVAYILFMNIILMPIRLIVELYSMALRAMAGAERIFEILDTQPDIANGPLPQPAGDLAGNISFEHVAFRYDAEGKDVLSDFTLSISAGETVALVGRTGAGKTTVASLVGRFYDPHQGRISIDGRDITEYELDSLHQNMAIVPQEGFLFTGTVLQNLRLRAPNRTREEVEAVAKQLGTHDAISSLPNGYDTLVLEGGRSVSEGQRQLISITRALLASPRILILDEPTSALDVHTESILQDALQHLTKGRTSLIIAHRLSTIRNADRIVVIDEGRIVEMGNHAALMEKNGPYRRFVTEGSADEMLGG